MKKEDAIKFLQQIYPNGGHCWLDEQRIEAISMAVKALQEGPVSENLEQVAITAADEDMQGRQIMEESNENRQLYSRIFRRGFKAGAKWQQQQIMKDAVDGEIYFNLDALQYRIITEPLTGYYHGDKIKLISLKRTEL